MHVWYGGGECGFINSVEVERTMMSESWLTVVVSERGTFLSIVVTKDKQRRITDNQEANPSNKVQEYFCFIINSLIYHVCGLCGVYFVTVTNHNGCRETQGSDKPIWR